MTTTPPVPVNQDFHVLSAMKRLVEQRPNEYEGWLSEILETAAHGETERIDAQGRVFGRHLGRGPIWSTEGQALWIEGRIQVGQDDDGGAVLWPAGWLLTVGLRGPEEYMPCVETVLCNPNSGFVVPMPTKLTFDWRVFGEDGEHTQAAAPDSADACIVDISVPDTIRAGLGLQTAAGASLAVLMRMASGLSFKDNYSVHIVEDLTAGEVWRRTDEQFVEFMMSIGGTDNLRAMLAAVMLTRTVPDSLDNESADLLDGLDETIMLGGRGMLAGLDVLQFARRRCARATSKP
jgi:hypothetical protein